MLKWSLVCISFSQLLLVTDIGGKAPTQAEKQLELVHEETASGKCRGLATWLVEGLKIQELQ